MFSFFSKNNQPGPDFSALGADMHSHLIPGIDDGAPDLETSIALVKDMMGLGYRKIITTPHVMGDYYPNSSRTILEGLETLKKALQNEGIDIELHAAAEYHVDENFEALMATDDLLTLPGKRLLFELSFYGEPPNIEQTVFTLSTRGYRLILAHPERYSYYVGKMPVLQRFKDMGCALQVNILSLTGHYGEPTKKWATQLMKNEMIDYLGTDLHHKGHVELLQKALAQRNIQEILQKFTFQNSNL
jgi:tyrosine-protein phosphatase YwqE